MDDGFIKDEVMIMNTGTCTAVVQQSNVLVIKQVPYYGLGWNVGGADEFPSLIEMAGLTLLDKTFTLLERCI